MSRARVLADYVSSGDELAAVVTTANAALPKAGGDMTGAITTNSTFDGIDIATRDGVLTSTTTTAGAALPKAGGAMTGAITTNSTFDGVDIAVRDALHAPKASPAFTGTPTGITAAHLEAGVLPSDVTGGSGLTALGTVVSGILGSGVQLKVHYVTFESDATGTLGYVFGDALTIASGDNPSGAKWLVISGGGRFLQITSGNIYGTYLKYIENDDPVWSTTNGTLLTEILVPMQKYVDDSNSEENGMRIWTYTNAGSAQKVEFKMSIYVDGGTARCYAMGASGSMGILALRIH